MSEPQPGDRMQPPPSVSMSSGNVGREPGVAPPPTAVLPYATPFQYTTDGLWREGTRIVSPKNAPFPDRCVKCNAPAEGSRWRKRLYWHHPALYLLIIFPGLLVYVIVALCVRSSAQVEVGLCRAHWRRRNIRLAWAWGLALVGLAAVVTGFALVGEPGYRDSTLVALLVPIGLLLLLVGGIVGVLGSAVIWAKRIDKGYAWFSGAGPEFLASLPAAYAPPAVPPGTPVAAATTMPNIPVPADRARA